MTLWNISVLYKPISKIIKRKKELKKKRKKKRDGWLFF